MTAHAWLEILSCRLMQAAIAAGKIDCEAGMALRTASGIIGFHADRLTQILAFWPENAIEFAEVPVQCTIPLFTSTDDAGIDNGVLDGSLIWKLDEYVSGRCPIFGKLVKPATELPVEQEQEFNDIMDAIDHAFAWAVPDLLISARNHVSARLHLIAGLKVPPFTKLREKPAVALYLCPTCGQAMQDIAEMSKCGCCKAPVSALESYPRW